MLLKLYWASSLWLPKVIVILCIQTAESVEIKEVKRRKDEDDASKSVLLFLSYGSLRSTHTGKAALFFFKIINNSKILYQAPAVY